MEWLHVRAKELAHDNPRSRLNVTVIPRGKMDQSGNNLNEHWVRFARNMANAIGRNKLTVYSAMDEASLATAGIIASANKASRLYQTEALQFTAFGGPEETGAELARVRNVIEEGGDKGEGFDHVPYRDYCARLGDLVLGRVRHTQRLAAEGQSEHVVFVAPDYTFEKLRAFADVGSVGDPLNHGNYQPAVLQFDDTGLLHIEAEVARAKEAQKADLLKDPDYVYQFDDAF